MGAPSIEIINESAPWWHYALGAAAAIGTLVLGWLGLKKKK